LRAALQFLTILPVPAPNVPPGSAAVWYPAVGAIIGLVAAAVATHSPLGATLAIVVVVVLTGGLHEDGLADICDAVRAGRTRERIFEILKDSRIGAYGATAIALSILVRWQAMSKLSEPWLWWKYVLAFAASRAAMVVLAAATPAAAPGLGETFRASLPRYAAYLVAAQVLAVVVAISAWPAFLAAAASVVATRAWLIRRMGGVTGDGLGFQCQVTEATVLVALAWQA
jgi:adenosylcobinamide-GDP ribazoletransferase